MSRLKRALLLLGLFSLPALAQNVAGSLQGIVRDGGGAVLAGARVLVKNVATGATWERSADASGRYQLPLLPPGEYEVHFSLDGFRPVARRGIRLTVGQDASVDATLELG